MDDTINAVQVGVKKPRQQAYSSPLMLERRQRILQEALAILSEGGDGKFSIRALSDRADVALQTIYHAFGDRSGVLAHAIAEHDAKMRRQWAKKIRGDDLQSILAEFDEVVKEVRINPNYVRTLVGLYFSPTPPDAAIQSIRVLPVERLERWLANTPGRTPPLGEGYDRFINRHVDSELCVFLAWSRGRLPVGQLADELRSNFLATLSSIAKDEDRIAVETEKANIEKRIGLAVREGGRSS